MPAPVTTTIFLLLTKRDDRLDIERLVDASPASARETLVIIVLRGVIDESQVSECLAAA